MPTYKIGDKGFARCVGGCGRWATKYCEAWNTSSTKPGKYGHFELSSRCGYPVCETCVHDGYNKHHQPVLETPEA